MPRNTSAPADATDAPAAPEPVTFDTFDSPPPVGRRKSTLPTEYVEALIAAVSALEGDAMVNVTGPEPHATRALARKRAERVKRELTDRKLSAVTRVWEASEDQWVVGIRLKREDSAE